MRWASPLQLEDFELIGFHKMKDNPSTDMVLRNFKIATMVDSTTNFQCHFSGKPIPKSAQHVNFGLLENATLGMSDGKFIWIGLDGEVPDLNGSANIVDGMGCWLTPGLIDCHTHLVYGGNRVNEWEMRLNGKGYEEIAREGGGILSTVNATRTASEEELFASAAERLLRLMSQGVTTVEIKSGYGLDVDTELKMLRVARKLEQQFPVSIETTLLGAHAVPPELKGQPDAYIDLVCERMIPQAKDLCSAVDIFCESIAFDLDQMKRVFESAFEAGLKVKVHAEQLTSMGAAALASELGALSADHLEYLTPNDCEVMGHNGTVATLLPGAFYCLQETQKPPIESLREFNVPIAVATDSNPGSSPLTSLLIAGNMACNLFGLTPAESFSGMTRNAARALGLQDSVGTIEVGKRADFALWDVQSPAEIIYGIGDSRCIQIWHAGKPTQL